MVIQPEQPGRSAAWQIVQCRRWKQQKQLCDFVGGKEEEAGRWERFGPKRESEHGVVSRKRRRQGGALPAVVGFLGELRLRPGLKTDGEREEDWTRGKFWGGELADYRPTDIKKLQNPTQIGTVNTVFSWCRWNFVAHQTCCAIRFPRVPEMVLSATDDIGGGARHEEVLPGSTCIQCRAKSKLGALREAFQPCGADCVSRDRGRRDIKWIKGCSPLQTCTR